MKRRAVGTRTPAPVQHRQPYAREPVDIFDDLPGEQGAGRFAAFLSERPSVTIPEVLDGLAIAPERRTRALAMRVGEALRDHGWAPTRRHGTGARTRIYTPAPPPLVVG